MGRVAMEVSIHTQLGADAYLAGARGSGSQSLLMRVIRAIRGFNGLILDEVRRSMGKASSAREVGETRDPIGF